MNQTDNHSIQCLSILIIEYFYDNIFDYRNYWLGFDVESTGGRFGTMDTVDEGRISIGLKISLSKEDEDSIDWDELLIDSPLIILLSVLTGSCGAVRADSDSLSVIYHSTVLITQSTKLTKESNELLCDTRSSHCFCASFSDRWIDSTFHLQISQLSIRYPLSTVYLLHLIWRIFKNTRKKNGNICPSIDRREEIRKE